MVSDRCQFPFHKRFYSDRRCYRLGCQTGILSFSSDTVIPWERIRSITMSSPSYYHHPMERVLYNLHRQTCTFAVRYTNSRTRSLVEKSILILAVCLFGALLLVHLTFVHRLALVHEPQQSSIPLTCLSSIRHFNYKADITHVYLVDDAESWAYTTPATKQRQDLKEQASAADPSTCSAETTSDSISNNTSYVAHTRTRAFVELSYSRVKAYLLLPPHLVNPNHISVQQVFVSKRDPKCFGEPFLQELVFRLMGPETVMMNWFLALHDIIMSQEYQNFNTNNLPLQTPPNSGTAIPDFSPGYIFNPHTELLLALRPLAGSSPTTRQQRRTAHHPDTTHYYNTHRRDSPSHYGMQLAGSKLSVVLKTCFLYFITTTLVSFTLRETQERMLDFTQQLQAHVRVRRSVSVLVTRHFVDNLVFVPIMVGMIFFLIEFYSGDKILSFSVLSVVWLCEVFSVVSVRSFSGIHFFPRIFFLLFALLHFYIFSFPFGFSYTALASAVCFMMHSMLFFWHRFELPAVVMGHVSSENPRMYQRSSSHSFPGQPTPQNLHEQSNDTDTHSSPRPVGNGGRRGNPSSVVSAAPAAAYNPGNLTRTPSQHFYASQPRLSPRMVRHTSRQCLRRGSSFGSQSRIMSRDTSSNALFQQGGDDDGSYMYFLGGEVVMHQHDITPVRNAQQAMMNANGLMGQVPSPAAIGYHPAAAAAAAAHLVDPLRNSPSIASNAGSDHSRRRAGGGIPDHVMAEVGLGPEDFSRDYDLHPRPLESDELSAHRGEPVIPLPTDPPYTMNNLGSLQECIGGTSESFDSSMDRQVILESHGGLPPIVLDESSTENNDETLRHDLFNDETPIRDNRGINTFSPNDPRVKQAPRLPRSVGPPEQGA